MNLIQINYKNTSPNYKNTSPDPILGRDIEDPGVYKNQDSYYKGSVYINQSGDKFYLDPIDGIQIYPEETWENDYFTKVDAKSVTIEL